MTDTRGGPFSNQWANRRGWKTPHYVLANGRVMWLNGIVGRTACGRHIAIDDRLEPEPTGIDTVDRCARCCKRLKPPVER